jgi:hypothetical protein
MMDLFVARRSVTALILVAASSMPPQSLHFNAICTVAFPKYAGRPEYRVSPQLLIVRHISLGNNQAGTNAMKNDVLSTLNSVAANSATSDGMEKFTDSLLDSIDANLWDQRARQQVRNLLLSDGLAPDADMQTNQFLGSTTAILERLNIKQLFTLSASDLFAARNALAKAMPNFFRDPTTHPGLLPAERVYLLYLLWIKGTWASTTKLPSASYGSGSRTVVTSGIVTFVGMRDKTLSAKSEAEIRKAFDELCALVAYRPNQGAA